MIHLLTFQSIKNVLYFIKIGGGYRNIFYTQPLTQHCIVFFFKFWGVQKYFLYLHPLIKIKFIFQIFGWYRSIFIPKMIHLLAFQSIKNFIFF